MIIANVELVLPMTHLVPRLLDEPVYKWDRCSAKIKNTIRTKTFVGLWGTRLTGDHIHFKYRAIVPDGSYASDDGEATALPT